MVAAHARQVGVERKVDLDSLTAQDLSKLGQALLHERRDRHGAQRAPAGLGELTEVLDQVCGVLHRLLDDLQVMRDLFVLGGGPAREQVGMEREGAERVVDFVG